MRFAFLQGGQDQRFQMSAKFISVNGVHGFILDRLGLNCQGKLLRIVMDVSWHLHCLHAAD